MCVMSFSVSLSRNLPSRCHEDQNMTNLQTLCGIASGNAECPRGLVIIIMSLTGRLLGEFLYVTRDRSSSQWSLMIVLTLEQAA